MADDRVACREALAELWAFLDREVDCGSEEQVRAHLERCRHCLPHYDFQRAFRAFMAARCRDGAPAALRRRIFLELLSEDGRNGGAPQP